MFQPIGSFKISVFERRTSIGSYNHCRYQICIGNCLYSCRDALAENLCTRIQTISNTQYKTSAWSGKIYIFFFEAIEFLFILNWISTCWLFIVIYAKMGRWRLHCNKRMALKWIILDLNKNYNNHFYHWFCLLFGKEMFPWLESHNLTGDRDRARITSYRYQDHEVVCSCKLPLILIAFFDHQLQLALIREEELDKAADLQSVI